MAGSNSDVARVLDPIIKVLKLIWAAVLAILKCIRNDTFGVVLKEGLPAQNQPVQKLLQVARSRHVIYLAAQKSRAANFSVGFGADQYASAGHAVVPEHVVEMVVEPPRHRERLRDGRIEPRFDHIAAAWRRLQIMGDLQPTIGIDLAVEYRGHRRTHVKGEMSSGSAAANARTQKQNAGRNRACRENERIRPHLYAPPIFKLARDAGYLFAPCFEPLRFTAGQDSEPFYTGIFLGKG